MTEPIDLIPSGGAGAPGASPPVPVPELQAQDVVKELGRCLSFIAVVQEVRAIPGVKQEQGAGRARRRDRERRKGVQKHPSSEPTGEFLWWLSINGGVNLNDRNLGERMALAINSAVAEGLKAEIEQATARRRQLMKEEVLTLSDFSRLQEVQWEVAELIEPWVKFVDHGPGRGFVGVQRQNPIQFKGEGAGERAKALADYVNAVVRPFVDPIQMKLQQRLYAFMAEDPTLSIFGL